MKETKKYRAVIEMTCAVFFIVRSFRAFRGQSMERITAALQR
jgi:hypothetical protein